MLARLVRAVALLLLAGQAIVVQAHQHAPGTSLRAVAVAAPVALQSMPGPPRPDDPLSCPVCREIAHAAAYLTPGPVTLAVPTTTGHWSPSAILPTRSAGRPSHSWQSRAPPIELHA